MLRPLESESIERLESIFSTARGDISVLSSLEAELQHRPTSRARVLRLKVIAARMAAKQKAGAEERTTSMSNSNAPSNPPVPPRPTTMQTSRPLQALLAAYNLCEPDGRPLHAYRLEADTHADLEKILQGRARANRLHNFNREDAALFVIWAAEWFRRHYRGGLRKYEDLGSIVGVEFEQKHWRDLVDEGIKWWRREVIWRSSGGHRLLTLALEGGFPTAVLEDNKDGWLVRYLNGLMSALLAIQDADLEVAQDLAWSRRDGLRETYRHDEFCALSADLALSIVKLRREAERASGNLPGLQLSAVLDAVRPEWRKDLSIASEGAAAKRLIDGMLAVRALTSGASEIGVTRLLMLDGPVWRPAVRLGLNGEIATDRLPGFRSGDGRIRVYAHGALAQIIGRELAMLDPPGDIGGTWLLRPLLNATAIRGVPLASRVEVSLHAIGRAAATMPWPHGEAVSSDVLTFSIDQETGGKPIALALIARGSARVRNQKIVVLIPKDWTIKAQTEEVQSLGECDDGSTLWLSQEPLIATSPDGTLAYRVEPGQEESSRDRLELHGRPPFALASDNDTIQLIAGSPSVSCVKGRMISKAGVGEVLWRRHAQEPWHDVSKERIPPGLVDVIWRDVQTQFIRDRQRIAVLPENAALSIKPAGSATAYTFSNTKPLSISVLPMPGLGIEQSVDGTTFSLQFNSRPRRRVSFHFRGDPKARPIVVTARFPQSAGLAREDGELVAASTVLTPAVLAGLKAFGDGRQTLSARLSNPGMPQSEPSFTTFEDEMPLRGLADQLEKELRAVGSIDARFDLEFVSGRRSRFTIKWFDSELVVRDGVFSVRSISGLQDQDLTIVARPVEQPDSEVKIADLNLADVLNRRELRMPDQCSGTWLVYLRSGHTIRSRPQLVTMPGKHVPDGLGLAAAAAETTTHRRRIAIQSCLAALEADAPAAMIDFYWLQRLIRSLDGLPAVTFNALEELADAPIALARLLLISDDQVQAATWAMESELPFLWGALPLPSWTSAAAAASKAIEEQLANTDLAKSASELASSTINAAAQRVRLLDPKFNAILGLVGLGGPPAPLPGPSLHAVAADYVRRTLDRDDTGVRRPKQVSQFRAGRMASLLPQEFQSFDPQHLETLDAPCAVALSACGLATLTRSQIAACKIATVADPTYFSQGYAMMLYRLASTSSRVGTAG
jgi:hypothetical protein